jgi:predicted nuclease with TOPRIM domain
MREQLEQRLKVLKDEFEAGQKMLTELEAKQASVRETLMRINGAFKLLKKNWPKRMGHRPNRAKPASHSNDKYQDNESLDKRYS